MPGFKWTRARAHMMHDLGNLTMRSGKYDGNARYVAEALRRQGWVTHTVNPSVPSNTRILPRRIGGHTIEVALTPQGFKIARSVPREWIDAKKKRARARP